MDSGHLSGIERVFPSLMVSVTCAFETSPNGTTFQCELQKFSPSPNEKISHKTTPKDQISDFIDFSTSGALSKS